MLHIDQPPSAPSLEPSEHCPWGILGLSLRRSGLLGLKQVSCALVATEEKDAGPRHAK